MGDPKRLRKKYEGPSHPWKKARIEEEAVLVREYGLKNKKEIWRMNTKLKNFKEQAKKLSALRTAQAEKEKADLLNKLKRIGLLSETSVLADILSLSGKDLMERRLQTLVYKRGLAHSIKQARQFIVHRHIAIGEKKLISPAHIVNVNEENEIKFAGNSPIKNEDHPERTTQAKKQKPRPEKKDDRGRKGRERRRPPRKERKNE